MSLKLQELQDGIYEVLLKRIPTASSNAPKGVIDGVNLAKQQAREDANSIGSLIDSFVKSGEVSFTSGQITGTTPDVQSGTQVPLTAGAGTGGKVT